jgi:hypothetical protein
MKYEIFPGTLFAAAIPPISPYVLLVFYNEYPRPYILSNHKQLPQRGYPSVSSYSGFCALYGFAAH